MKCKWFTGYQDLAELYQSSGYYFSFASHANPANPDEVTQCHPWIKCRDFLQDAVRAQLTGDPCSIFGFKFDAAKQPAIDLGKTVLLVARDTGIPTEEVERILSVLNYFEKVAGIIPTRALEVDESGQERFKSIHLLVGSRIWVMSPVLISLYSFLIRVAGCNKVTVPDEKGFLKQMQELSDPNAGDRDKRYLADTWSKLFDMVRMRNALFPKKGRFHDMYFKDASVNNFHDHSGIVALCKATTCDKELNVRAKELLLK